MLIRLSLAGAGPGVYRRHANLFPGWISPSISPAIFGIVRDTGPWEVAFALYFQDKMAEAREVVAGAGIGDFAEYAEAARVVDSEGLAAQYSLITRISGWLEVEVSPANGIELYELAPAADLIEGTFRRFGLEEIPQTLLTILPPEAPLPAFLDYTGYVTFKEPYAKYCLPHRLAKDKDRLAVAVPALAASHVAGLLSAEGARQWLLCASQAVAAPPVSAEIRSSFQSGEIPWLEPMELDARLMGLRLGEDEREVTSAHDQARLVGDHLLKVGGVSTLKRCLAYLNPDTLWQHLRLQFSRDPVGDACKRAYGYAPEYLFEHALASTSS